MADKIHCYGDYGNDGGKMYGFQCPGCKYGHHVTTPRWTWNGSLEAPTFTPSILVNGNTPSARCHSFVKDGKIQFLNDCFHELKGQTVDLPDWES